MKIKSPIPIFPSLMLVAELLFLGILSLEFWSDIQYSISHNLSYYEPQFGIWALLHFVFFFFNVFGLSNNKFRTVREYQTFSQQFDKKSSHGQYPYKFLAGEYLGNIMHLSLGLINIALLVLVGQILY